MSLNIKSAEAHRLAHELTSLTGQTLTGAVTEALRKELQHAKQRQGESRTDRLLAIGRDVAGRLREPYRTAKHADLLYNDRGLPE